MTIDAHKVEIISSYKSGRLVSEIANDYNVNRRTITRLLNKYEVKRRSHSDIMQSYYATSIPINSSLITNINGWLLGDGCLPFSRTKQTCFSFSTQHEAYANFVSDMLSKNSIPNSIYKTYRKRFDKDYFTVRSFSSMELGELYKKWYSNRVKIVPKDLILHPSTVRNWIMDDGTRHKHSDAMILSTNSFSKNECYSLLEKLKEIVNEGYMSVQNGKNGPRIYLNKISANKLLEYVGSCDVKVFDYKFYKVGV